MAKNKGLTAKMSWLQKYALTILLTVVTLAATIVFRHFFVKSYNRYDTDSLQFDRARVVRIAEEEIQYDESQKLWLGTQELEVEFLEGQFKGQTLQVTNYLTNIANVLAEQNSKLIIKVDAPENTKPYFTVYNYDRSGGLVICALILAAAVFWIGGRKGIKSILALGYSLFLIVYLLLPWVYSGYSPIGGSLLVALLSTAVTLLLLNGRSKKTGAATLSTLIGLLSAAGLFWLMSAILHINGFSVDSAENLVLIQRNTGLQIKELLFAGVLIASLGAVMDVAMSIVSSMQEIHDLNPQMTAKALFRSGMSIGRDVIGTMTNTLILAFAGSAFITLLIFISYQVQFNQLISSNYLAIEIAQGICGTFGIVLTVPAASFISAMMLKGKAKK